ncbi:MAG: poly-gamma-glutamate system protein [Tissierellia bacterium]|nr:poly-gamma-glutamate system protein [Tissierellia bacterium]MDD4725942.1 poly-gamma-glutamate system protein [Tissierellia bacterium]
MKKRFSKYDKYILIMTLLLVVFYIFITDSKSLVKDPLYEEKYRAASIMKECSEKIKEEKVSRNIELGVEDINKTGLIGEEMNGITTTLGSIESKRTSTNPNFAAVIIDMLDDGGVKKGDYVAVSFSSSFPALNIATIVACQVMEVNPIIITSVGASTWGGNNLEFTYLDMEEYLFNEGLIKNKTIVVSPGGSGDMGRDMNPDELNIILDRMRYYGKTILLEEDLESNIALRKDIYFRNSNRISCFINIGGNIVAFGDTTDSINASNGLIIDEFFNTSRKTGLVQFFSSKDVPVMNIINIKDLANEFGLAIDPSTPFIIGEGNVYYTYSYPLKTVFVVVIMSFCLLIILKRIRSNYED